MFIRNIVKMVLNHYDNSLDLQHVTSIQNTVTRVKLHESMPRSM